MESPADGLARLGYVHCRTPETKEAFYEVSRTLGTTFLESTVQIVEGSRKKLHSNAAFEPHSDHPLARYIAWYCDVADEEGGETVLLDTADIASRLSTETLSALKRVIINWPPLRTLHTSRAPESPLVSEDAGRLIVHYASWLVKSVPEESRAAMDVFLQYLEEKRQNGAIRVRLEPGHTLFLDNHRFLHGRDRLPEGSRRSLTRLWIAEPNVLPA